MNLTLFLIKLRDFLVLVNVTISFQCRISVCQESYTATFVSQMLSPNTFIKYLCYVILIVVRCHTHGTSCWICVHFAVEINCPADTLILLPKIVH